MTADEYLALSETDRRQELAGGVLIMSPNPSFKHQRAAMRLGDLFRSQIEDTGRGLVLAVPYDVYVDQYDFVAPDLMVILDERTKYIENRFREIGPNIAVEILSPSTRDRDEKIKPELYRKAGVQEYWIVDAGAPMVTVHGFYDPPYTANCRKGSAVDSRLVSIKVDDIFANLVQEPTGNRKWHTKKD
ncbi:MAG: Uma2 family endonuclease [Terriglobia bacterium]